MIRCSLPLILPIEDFQDFLFLSFILVTITMNPELLISLILFVLLNTSLSQTCKRSCARIPLHYPFGSGPGCGSPAFHPHVACDDADNLLLLTHTGSYHITNIDYTNQLLYIQDTSMSTCSSTTPSTGFSLDWDAPFTFIDGDIFALLGCSSPLFASNDTDTPLCDATNAHICSLLYSCQAISALGEPVSTCCIYTPVNLGPAFEMDLGKLQCRSYAGVYSFNGAETNPGGWKFGVALKYRFSVDDGYPRACADCESSNGVCGYTGQYNSFTCNCGNGVNTTTNCKLASEWSHGSRVLLPLWIGLGLISSCCAMFWDLWIMW